MDSRLIAKIGAFAVLLCTSAALPGCIQQMDDLAGSAEPLDRSNLPGTTDWNALDDPDIAGATSGYKLPGLYPCMNCHSAMEPNPEPRALTGMHADIDAAFNHANDVRWCTGCHDLNDRNMLHMADGHTVPFEQHYKLCGQCHQSMYKDWKAGIHGKRTGQWNGEKRWYVCVECHNPHHPKFESLEPKPAPMQPSRIGKDRPGGAAPAEAPEHAEEGSHE